MKLLIGLILIAVCLVEMARGDCFKSEEACKNVCDLSRGQCEPCQKSQCICTQNCYDTNATCLNNCKTCTVFGIPSSCISVDWSICSGAGLFTCSKLPGCYDSKAACDTACKGAGSSGNCIPASVGSCYYCYMI